MYMDLKIKELIVYEVKVMYTTYRFDTKEEAVLFQVGYKDGTKEEAVLFQVGYKDGTKEETNGSSASYMLGNQVGISHSDRELKKYGMDAYYVNKAKVNSK